MRNVVDPKYPEYIRPSINSDDIAEGLCVMLRELFSDAEYSDDMKYIYMYVCKNSIEDAIYREILANTDILQLDFENGGKKLDNKRKFMLRLAVVYFLHCRHNAKLLRCKAEFGEIKEADSYLARRVFRAAEKCCPDAYARFIADTPEVRELFREASSMSIVFEDTRYTEPVKGEKHKKSVFKHILYAPNYQDGNIQVIISIKKAEYKNHTTYENCLTYLISSNGNAISSSAHYDDGFRSTEVVWRNAMNEYRRPLLGVTARNAHDNELVLFCLALGLTYDVYDWLKKCREAWLEKRREEKRLTGQNLKTAAPKKPKNPPIGDEELAMLEDFLRNASERLMSADDQARGQPLTDTPKLKAYAKSRNMIINATLDLLKHKMRPITVLRDEEIESLLRSNEITQETLDYIYSKDKDERIFNPDLKHDGICKILLDKCDFSKLSIEALSLIKAKYLELGLEAKGSAHLNYDHVITKEEMVQERIPEDIAELLTSTRQAELKPLLDCASVRKKFGNI